MKSIFKISFICLISLFVFYGCSQNQKPDLTAQDIAKVRKDIEQTWKQFIVKWEQGDAVAVADFYTDDAINMPLINLTQKGKDEIATLFTDMLSTNKIDVVSQNVNEVFVHENMVYEFGTLEQIVKPRDAEATTQKFRYISVFKKQSDGSWKFHRWMGQSNR